MQKKANINLPGKKMNTKVNFGAPVLCDLNVAMAGKTSETLTDEERTKFTTTFCVHPMWPAFLPQCKVCLLSNKHVNCMVDKKGREYKLTAPRNPNEKVGPNE